MKCPDVLKRFAAINLAVCVCFTAVLPSYADTDPKKQEEKEETGEAETEPLSLFEKYSEKYKITLKKYSVKAIKEDLNKKYKEYIVEYIDQVLANSPEYIKRHGDIVDPDCYVSIDLKGYVDKESSPSINYRNYVLHIGSGTLPDLESALIGERMGNEIRVIVTNGVYDSIYGGNNIEFTAKLNCLATPRTYTYETLTASYTKDTLGYDSIDDFLKAVNYDANIYAKKNILSYMKQYFVSQYGPEREFTKFDLLPFIYQYRKIVINQKYNGSYKAFADELTANSFTEQDFVDYMLDKMKIDVPYMLVLNEFAKQESLYNEEKFGEWIIEKAGDQSPKEYVALFETPHEPALSYLKKQFLAEQAEALFTSELPEINSLFKEVSVEEGSGYRKYRLPDYPGNKTWMDWRKITAVNSRQYKLQKYAVTAYDGIRTVNGRYCIAIGTFFNAAVGQYVDLILKNGTTIECIVGDIKDDRDTDENNVFTVHSNCCSEFVVDIEVLTKDVQVSGDTSKLYSNWESPVQYIVVHDTVAVLN